MGIFSKESCAVCMADVNLLTRAKLKDGYLCGACKKEISPFFGHRKEASTALMKEHLIYRRRNKQTMSRFVPTEIISAQAIILYVDERDRTFLFGQYRDWKKGNPDIFSLDMVKDCRVQVAKHEHEEHQGPESPVATITTYSYEIFLKVYLKGTWLDDCSVKLHGGRITSNGDYEDTMKKANRMRDILLGENK